MLVGSFCSLARNSTDHCTQYAVLRAVLIHQVSSLSTETSGQLSPFACSRNSIMAHHLTKGISRSNHVICCGARVLKLHLLLCDCDISTNVLWHLQSPAVNAVQHSSQGWSLAALCTAGCSGVWRDLQWHHRPASHKWVHQDLLCAAHDPRYFHISDLHSKFLFS